VAIVSDVAGTTRDVLEVHLDLGGYPVIVADTAGLRETADSIESEGVRRALARADAADAVLLLLDATAPEAEVPYMPRTPRLTVWNKVDAAGPVSSNIAISVKTGLGLDELLTAIGNIVRTRVDLGQTAAPLTRQRHRHGLRAAAVNLQHAISAVEPELLAEELRMALRDIGRISGRVDVEDLLDVVFRDFCIGK
jgi:tRNA modification GTPase